MTKHEAAIENWHTCFTECRYTAARRWWQLAETLRSGSIWSGRQDDDPFAADGAPTDGLANVQAALNDALASLAAYGKTEAQAEKLIAAGLGRTIRPAWYEAAWAVVSTRRQLREMETSR